MRENDSMLAESGRRMMSPQPSGSRLRGIQSSRGRFPNNDPRSVRCIYVPLTAINLQVDARPLAESARLASTAKVFVDSIRTERCDGP